MAPYGRNQFFQKRSRSRNVFRQHSRDVAARRDSSMMTREEVQDAFDQLRFQHAQQDAVLEYGNVTSDAVVPWSSVVIEEIASEHDAAEEQKALAVVETKQLVPALKVTTPTQPALVAAKQDSYKNPLATAAVELKFACQLAHGSPSAIIQRWNTMEELYKSIATSFNVKVDDIIFLTVNKFNVDMAHLFTGTLNFTDMLFAHIRGQPVEIELNKDEDTFGVTITDNGIGTAFIKAIKDGGVFGRAKPATAVGQLIEKINGQNMLGKRHYEVARVLRSIKKGSKLTLRLINPLQSGLQFLQPRGSGGAKKPTTSTNVTGTVRFKSNGSVVVEEAAPQKEMIDKLNEVFDTYLGVQDDQLAMRIWETASSCQTLANLTEAINTSELAMFEFPDALIFDMWGIVGDWKRANNSQATPTKPCQRAFF